MESQILGNLTGEKYFSHQFVTSLGNVVFLKLWSKSVNIQIPHACSTHTHNNNNNNTIMKDMHSKCGLKYSKHTYNALRL